MEKIKKMFKSVSSKNGTYSVGLTVLVLVIAVLVNLVAGQLPESMRNIDISDNGIYEISEVSEEILDELDKEVKLTVVADLDSVDQRIETFVKKYAALSKKIDLEWIDSVQHPSALQKYNTEGDIINVECEETGKSTQIAFDDIIKYDEYTYYMSGQLSETEFDGEGQLTSAIGYVTSTETKKIYRTSGHGEATFSTSVNELFSKNNLETSEINLSMNAQIPEDCDLLFLYAPSSDITDAEKTLIEDYLADGGNVYLILGTDEVDLPNLEAIMADYGLGRADGYIADMQRCYQNNYYAIFPQLTLTGDLGQGIKNEMVLLLNSHGLEKLDTEDDALTVSTFMETSTQSYAVREDGETEGQYILGAVAKKTCDTGDEDTNEDEEDAGSGDTEESEVSRLTVVASDSLISADITDQLTTLDNLTLFVNSVMNNFDDVENVAIEAKSLSVEQNTPVHAGTISLIIIFVIPIAILVIGFVTWMRRRKS